MGVSVSESVVCVCMCVVCVSSLLNSWAQQRAPMENRSLGALAKNEVITIDNNKVEGSRAEHA